MNYNIEYFRGLEEKLVKDELVKKLPSDSLSIITPPTDKEINEVYKTIHSRMISTMISHYMEKRCLDYTLSCYKDLFIGDFVNVDIIPDDIDIDSIPLLCEALHISFLNSTFVYSNNHISRKKSKSNLLESGSVYTQEQIAYSIVSRTIKNTVVADSRNIKVLDFATGTGRFYRQIVKSLKEIYEIPATDSILHNIYAVDIDPIAINVCRINAISFLDRIELKDALIISSHIILKNALIKEDVFQNELAISVNDCNGLFFNGFNAVVSNPPYLVLKANKNKMDAETVDSINRMCKYFRSSTFYRYSIEGMLNLYQLSLEAMLGMLQEGGQMGIICPSTLFADISASSLRKHLLSQNNITYIKYFSEDEPLFDNVTQATCIFHLQKGGTTSTIDISQGKKNYKISLDDVKHVFCTNWEIPSIEKVEWVILKKLLSVSILKNYSFIRNKRGELDLSLYKEYITNTPTELRLVRGNMISDNGLNDINHEYVLPSFLEKKSDDYKKFDYGNERLVCQQISNQTQRRRLRFVLCEKKDILGNSCNYISVKNEYIPFVSALLNSALLNWRFKITSTNNHINNYELDELPIIDIEKIDKTLLTLVGKERDRKICELYGLGNTEIEYILSQHYDIA